MTRQWGGSLVWKAPRGAQTRPTAMLLPMSLIRFGPMHRLVSCGRIARVPALVRRTGKYWRRKSWATLRAANATVMNSFGRLALRAIHTPPPPLCKLRQCTQLLRSLRLL